jgi:hypothetical protein
MARLVSGIAWFCGLLATVWILASVSGFGWAQQRDSMVLRGPMSESPFIRVQGGCKNLAEFNACQAAENNKPGGCNWASSCSGQVNRDCANKYC